MKESIAWLCALVLSLVFIASGLSKLLWCRYFERVLYEYRLGLSYEYYKIIRAYLPCLEIGLGIALWIRRFRVACMYLVLAMLAVFISVQLVTLMRGITASCGCLGPYADSLVGVTSIARNILFLCVACAPILPARARSSFPITPKHAALLAGILVLLVSGCGGSKNQPSVTNNLPRSNQHQQSSGSQAVSAPISNASARGVAGPVTDTILKGMDDFSAALGLQYARLSYDTNRYLLDYANIIPKLSDEEFLDLVRDFLHARRGGASAEEITFLRQMIGDRMSTTWQKGNYDDYGMCTFYLTLTLEHNQDTAEIEKPFQQALANFRSALQKELDTPTEGALYQIADTLGIGSAMANNNLMATRYEKELKALSALPNIPEKMKFALLMRATSTKLESDPRRAQLEYEELVERWPKHLRDHYYVEARACADGISKGLSGDALAVHVREQLTAVQNSNFS